MTTMTTGDRGSVIGLYHKALNPFACGNAQPIKPLWSLRDDVTLANPFGPAVVGWKKVSEAMDFASSRFKDGELTSVNTIAKYETPELVTILEIENWKAKIGGRQEVSSMVLRVTSTFRYEDGEWKLVHRHADPINSFNPDGPLRGGE
jgi:ketosteroid isomerase-like protein